MPRGLRRFMLSAHVVTSVGWLGAVAVFLGLAIIGLSGEMATLRAVYVVLEPAAWAVLVPLAVGSLLSGLVVSLGSAWGLFRHYWVIFKLVINVVALAVLLLYTRTLSFLADAVATGDTPRTTTVVLHSALAMVLLLTATGLAVYKPRGLTRHGWRVRQRAER